MYKWSFKERCEMKIDGVFSGGGIRGYALVGAIKAVQEKGFSFERVAGTSAGSVVASFVAAGYTGEELEKMMMDIELDKFLDERKSIFPSSVVKWVLLYWKLGMYKGQALEKWIEKKLADKGIYSFGDLPKGTLRVIVSDLTTSRMLVLPDDLESYNYDPAKFPIAKAVRMSASLPYFFDPVRLFHSNVPSIIVDGGVLSNFPIWLFEQTKKERKRPLLGIKLSPSVEDRPPNKITNALTMYKALFETMMDAHDSRYISRSVEKDIIFVPVKDVLTREFSISEEKKKEMIDIGFNTASTFLKKWTY
jgi:NTE family protein